MSFRTKSESFHGFANYLVPERTCNANLRTRQRKIEKSELSTVLTEFANPEIRITNHIDFSFKHYLAGRYLPQVEKNTTVGHDLIGEHG